MLAAVILLIGSLFVWSSVTAVESYAGGMAEVRGGVLTLTFDDAEKAANVNEKCTRGVHFVSKYA